VCLVISSCLSIGCAWLYFSELGAFGSVSQFSVGSVDASVPQILI
jgi:hypothetical protein